MLPRERVVETLGGGYQGVKVGGVEETEGGRGADGGEMAAR